MSTLSAFSLTSTFIGESSIFSVRTISFECAIFFSSSMIFSTLETTYFRITEAAKNAAFFTYMISVTSFTARSSEMPLDTSKSFNLDLCSFSDHASRNLPSGIKSDPSSPFFRICNTISTSASLETSIFKGLSTSLSFWLHRK
uniref:Uncharacterized protein n=1 Tax=Triticum urartu TaxID=4572 RepID=A0A8R7QYA3_TRIUA